MRRSARRRQFSERTDEDEEEVDDEEVVDGPTLEQSAEVATNGLSHNGLNGASDEEGEENVVPDSDEENE